MATLADFISYRRDSERFLLSFFSFVFSVFNSHNIASTTDDDWRKIVFEFTVEFNVCVRFVLAIRLFYRWIIPFVIVFGLLSVGNAEVFLAFVISKRCNHALARLETKKSQTIERGRAIKRACRRKIGFIFKNRCSTILMSLSLWVFFIFHFSVAIDFVVCVTARLLGTSAGGSCHIFCRNEFLYASQCRTISFFLLFVKFLCRFCGRTTERDSE